jgi:hypothetical protein
MIDLRRTPSIQHAIALIGSTVEETVKNFDELDAGGPRPSLLFSRKLIKPLMEDKSLSWAISQCEHLKGRKNSRTHQANVNLITTFAPYAKGKAVEWFRLYPTDMYPIGSDIYIPINPYGFWAQNSRIHLLWVQPWKLRTLDKCQKAIFNTILEQRVFVGDFKNAKLEWVDLSEQVPGLGRAIEVLGRSDLGTVTSAELTEYMEMLRVGYRQYSDSDIAKARKEEAKADRARRRKEQHADRQTELNV